VLILVENAAIPYDRRVMAEANSLLANGYTVSIICPTASNQPPRELLGGVLVRRYRSRPSRGGAASQVAEYAVALVKTFALMVSLSRDPGFDVIHACNPPDLFFLVAWPFRLFGVRFVFDQHDLSPELYAALYGRDSGAVMRALRFTERRSYRVADAVITVNESYKRLAVSRGGVAPERVFVARNGPREGWPRPVAPRPELRRAREHLVVYMGVMGHQDGVDVLLDAIAVLTGPMGMTDVTFALVGDGNAAASLKEQARELGIEEFVDFVGWISDEEVLSAYLVTADACVCPEPSNPLNDHSTFIKVMEYMASTTPIVAFDLPETRVSAGEAAVYATPGDVEGFAALLGEVLADEEMRSRMRACAEERIGSLRWERQVPALLAAYECALGAKRRG
jgi:glycosyltransferase involved in cell wall biosynthesis